MRICLEAQPGELRRRQQLVFRDKSVLFSETTRPQTNVCTAIALESEEFGNYGHEFSKRRDSKFANLGALHVAHRYQNFSYAFSDIATSFWVAFEFGCEERVTIRGVVFFQEKTCNCDISSEDEEVVNPRTTMEANHRYVGWVAGAIFIQICVALETPRWAVLSKNAAPVELVEANSAQTHGVACTTDVLNNCAFMVHQCMPYLHHSAHGNGLALYGKGTFLPSAFHNGSINGKKHAKL